MWRFQACQGRVANRQELRGGRKALKEESTSFNALIYRPPIEQKFAIPAQPYALPCLFAAEAGKAESCSRIVPRRI